MKNVIRSLSIFLFVTCFLLVVYGIFLKPSVFTWGASQNEVAMSLPGDELAPTISSTRAITINAPAKEVWQWIVQLGADRGGFFSYSFIEKILGYEANDAAIAVDTYHDMKVGRIIPGTLPDVKSAIEYNFEVVAVDPGKSFVLKNWGAFVLREIDEQQTRLLVRSHGRKLNGLAEVAGDFVMMSLHYFMERRMMMEFKRRAESGSRLSPVSDLLWFAGVVFSMIGIAAMIFKLRGFQSIALPMVYGLGWLWTLLIANPYPVYSLVLLLITVLTLVRPAAK